MLSTSHPAGGPKATFFRGMGFTENNWEMLPDALLAHARDHAVVSVVSRGYGMMYVVEGVIHTPSLRAPTIRSVWIVDNGTEIPRLVSAYPLDRKSP